MKCELKFIHIRKFILSTFLVAKTRSRNKHESPKTFKCSFLCTHLHFKVKNYAKVIEILTETRYAGYKQKLIKHHFFLVLIKLRLI